MPHVDRTPWHNTFIYCPNNYDNALVSLLATNGITNNNLHFMLEMICSFTDDYDLYNEEEELLERYETQLVSGNYYIVTNGMFYFAWMI